MTIFSGTARLVEILASLLRKIRALWHYDPLIDDHRAAEPFAREHVTLEPVITKFGQVISTRRGLFAATFFDLQAASAAFTPGFQAIIPDILNHENDYTNA